MRLNVYRKELGISMGKSIYKHYKNRLIEIGGTNKCLYLKGIARKSSYDVGKIIAGRDKKLSEFSELLWSKDPAPLTLISNKEKTDILENLDIESRIFKKDERVLKESEDDKAEKAEKRQRKISSERAIESEITRLTELRREVEEIERETGRYELYIGYPFVFGILTQGFQKTAIKAPLLLFPVKIESPDESTVLLSLNKNAKIHINPALVFAYSQAKKISSDALELEFDDLSDFGSIEGVLEYLSKFNIKIGCVSSKNVYDFSKFKEPTEKELSVRHAAVMARYPISSSIYNDYSILQKKSLTNDAISELLLTGKRKKKKPDRKKGKKCENRHSYTVKMLDYAQAEVVRRSDESGNMVIYGPPGTGKSQAIVNVISDAMAKGKRVLVVSQKKAALDVVFNRLGTLNSKAIYVSDECREKRAFYNTVIKAHNAVIEASPSDENELIKSYVELEKKLSEEEDKLKLISKTMNEKTPYGLSLAEMYCASTNFAKNTTEYDLYQKMLAEGNLLSLNHKELSEAIFRINNDSLLKTYYEFEQKKIKNPLFNCVFSTLDLRALAEAKGELEALMHHSRRKVFMLNEYPLYSKVLAYYGDCDDEKKIDRIIKLEAGAFWHFRRRKKLKAEFMNTLSAIDDFARDFGFLRLIFKNEGYVSIIDNLVRGNYAYLKNVHMVLTDYIAERNTAHLLSSLPESTREILAFAYKNAKNYQSFGEIIDKIPVIRIYHEIVYFEEYSKDALSLTADFSNVTERICKLKDEQLRLSAKIAELCAERNYKEYYESQKENKNYHYQISKTQKFWPIRKLMESFGDYLLRLFPCWLLSPENVSNLLPLEKNLFDTVIFDEASQVFIESTIPTIYRGKTIVVAGDAKQLRPSTTFMKRYLGADPDVYDDLSMQAALEVESLLDLAVSRYESANLTYHYRSQRSELIDFSNNAFYDAGLRIAPNTSKNRDTRPIVRRKVSGVWIDRTNPKEAEEIVRLLKEIFKTRKNGESIGIISFNSDQQSCISDTIDKECIRDPEFARDIHAERHRIENGEDVSLFIKNLENVQGEERDIIIFSIGYAKNPEGRLHAGFGSLSTDGGENRLNVAITRAKSQIIVVTSIEPEELKVENTKNLGPRLLKSYLQYVRSVSDGNAEETRAILNELKSPINAIKTPITAIKDTAERIKERLTKLGYTVDMNLGNSKSKISLAIYDEESDRYLVGIQLDTDAYESSSSILERDVYGPKFLENRGWRIMRVWCRDFWLSPLKVIKQITAAAEEERGK